MSSIKDKSIDECVDDHPLAFCASCGNLVQSSWRPSTGRARPRRLYCHRHTRTHPKFEAWLRRLRHAARNNASARELANDRANSEKLESGLRHLAAEICGAGYSPGTVDDRDIAAWSMRIAGISPDSVGEALDISRRSVSASAKKVAVAVERASQASGAGVALRDTLLGLGVAANIGQFRVAVVPARPLAVTARKLDQHCKALHRDCSSIQDSAAIVRLLIESQLLRLLHPAALLPHIPSLPVDAFDPCSYLRGLVGRSRKGRPLATGKVLAAYALAAKSDEARANTPWYEDPSYVLLSAVGALRHAEREKERGRDIPASPPGVVAVCVYCWRDADPISARCSEHARMRRQPSERLAFEEWRRGLVATVREIEPELRKSGPFGEFAKLVERAEQEWDDARRQYLSERTDGAKANFDNATVAYEMLVRERQIELSPTMIHRVAHDLALRKIRRKHLAIGILLQDDDRPGVYASIAKSLGASRQAIWAARHAGKRAKSVADEIVAKAVPTPPIGGLKQAHQRVELQRQTLSTALRRLAVGGVER